MTSALWRYGAQVVAWAVAAAWCKKTADGIRHLPLLPDISEPEWDLAPKRLPTLTVVVPAKDEAENIGPTVEALLAADYSELRIVAIDDRSQDSTGARLDDLSAKAAITHPGRLEIVHIEHLPAGWLGKTHAMSVAVQSTSSEYLLFTDADVLFSPSVLRRALAYAEHAHADHLVVLPTMLVKSHGEGVILGFFQMFGLWASRPWRVADPKAKRDVIGVGAFNLLRRDALEKIGGLEPQRLVVLEDITLGRRIKAAGLQQHIAFAPGMVQVHWAKGARGLVGVMTKNLFSGFNFQPLLLLGACLWIVVFCLAPFAGLFWWGTLVPSLLVLMCIGASYRLIGRVSRIRASYGWLYPLGALAFLWAMARSAVTVWAHRGVRWRGTHYDLRELRKHNSPFRWERAAAELRKLERRR